MKIAYGWMLCIAMSIVAGDARAEADMQAVVAGNTAFALDLYGKLGSGKGNLFFSPYSLSAALAMTYGGARKETADQMAKTLHFMLNQEQLHPAFAELETQLMSARKKDAVLIDVANSLWPQKDYPLLKEYLDLAKKYYGVSITPVDYKLDIEGARRQINTWVDRKTDSRIQNLIQPGLLQELTRLVLVNAIYFKGKWLNQFDPKNTKEEAFQLSPDKIIPVPMMTVTKSFGYAEHQDLQVLELPYMGRNLSMLVLLPKKADGLAELEKTLSVEKLKEWTGNLAQREVRVVLPKFKMTWQFRLDETLRAMGMENAFSPQNADFSGMDGRVSDGLYIGAVVHKAFVEVTEEGTEAAAATAVAMMTKSAGMPVFFKANHPFLFLIRDTRSASILFMGRVSDPSKD